MHETNQYTRIHDVLRQWVKTTPQAPALRDGSRRWTYRALDDASRQAASILESVGVRAGDRVMVVGENSAAIAVCTLAASRLDAWICIVNSRLSVGEVDNLIAHARPRRCIYTTGASPEARDHASRHGALPFELFEGADVAIGPLDEAAPLEPCEPVAGQVAALIYTSGTSGAPKGVMLTHGNLLYVAEVALQVRRLGPGDLVYGVLPMAHIVGLATQFLAVMRSGAEVALAARFSPEQVYQALQQDVTAFSGVPAMYARLLEWTRERGLRLYASQLRMIGVAGSPLTLDLKNAIEHAFQLPALNGYGLTETAPTVAQVRLDAPRADCAVGHPVPGVEVRIVDARGDAVADGDIGELHVRGPNVMKGYYQDAQHTREAIDAYGWFVTGDLARRGSDGALHIAGRSKELIIRSGFNVYPLEVEQAINSFTGVRQSAVVGRTVAHNEEVVAYVEPQEGHAVDVEALRVHLRFRLSPYKQPAEIYVMPLLPAAPTGKLLKGALKMHAANQTIKSKES